MISDKYKEYFDIVINNKGNCEDLLFNFVYIKLYNKKPIHVRGKIDYLDTSEGFSTTSDLKHNKIRNNFCRNIDL